MVVVLTVREVMKSAIVSGRLKGNSAEFIGIDGNVATSFRVLVSQVILYALNSAELACGLHLPVIVANPLKSKRTDPAMHPGEACRQSQSRASSSQPPLRPHLHKVQYCPQ